MKFDNYTEDGLRKILSATGDSDTIKEIEGALNIYSTADTITKDTGMIFPNRDGKLCDLSNELNAFIREHETQLAKDGFKNLCTQALWALKATGILATTLVKETVGLAGRGAGVIAHQVTKTKKSSETDSLKLMEMKIKLAELELKLKNAEK